MGGAGARSGRRCPACSRESTNQGAGPGALPAPDPLDLAPTLAPTLAPSLFWPHAADVVDVGGLRGRVSAKSIGPSRFFVVDRQVPEPNADTARPPGAAAPPAPSLASELGALGAHWLRAAPGCVADTGHMGPHNDALPVGCAPRCLLDFRQASALALARSLRGLRLGRSARVAQVAAPCSGHAREVICCSRPDLEPE